METFDNLQRPLLFDAAADERFEHCYLAHHCPHCYCLSYCHVDIGAMVGVAVPFVGASVFVCVGALSPVTNSCERALTGNVVFDQ